jgi:hypothetical protein
LCAEALLSGVAGLALQPARMPQDWNGVRQAKLLPEEHVQLKVYTCDSHRLAFILDQRGKLVPLLRAAILSEMGYRANNVRLGNLV